MESTYDILKQTEEKYDDLIHPRLGTDEEAVYQNIWNEHFAPMYCESWDALAMQKIACDILYPQNDDDFCSYTVEWNSVLGNREADVGEQLMARIISIARTQYQQLKAYRDMLNAEEL